MIIIVLIKDFRVGIDLRSLVNHFHFSSLFSGANCFAECDISKLTHKQPASQVEFTAKNITDYILIFSIM